ncbi:hypothetical protein DPEC_G00148240 [Dallia pectoralis]|uniref:Uncharacterized protein n=1 Tax=Dallia pectoralis TaxID=75939 RepID=A0ACC2GII7_DALPE|nr:hypothetical protein DPEC_G00148240 [Dallia pectoralis]
MEVAQCTGDQRDHVTAHVHLCGVFELRFSVLRFVRQTHCSGFIHSTLPTHPGELNITPATNLLDNPADSTHLSQNRSQAGGRGGRDNVCRIWMSR